MGKKSIQHGAAIALAELLAEHPNLPVAEWRIGSTFGDLYGSLFGGMEELAAYVDVLGGAVRAAEETYTLGNRELRRHALKTVWRDVQVEVAVTLPASVSAVAA